jgi:putative colanic acid biosynthesis acetyltransferase WcaF
MNPLPIDLSLPDNTLLQRGRPPFVEALWHFAGSPIVRSEFLPFSGVKCLVLRAFGAKIGMGVYIKPGLRVKFPWRLSVGDHTWLGERLWIDNLAHVTIGAHVCVSQDVYLCTGNHDWSHPNLKLYTASIQLKDGCWVAARSMVCPGVTVGECAVATGGSVVARDVPGYEVHGGNPASFMRVRKIRDSGASPVRQYNQQHGFPTRDFATKDFATKEKISA